MKILLFILIASHSLARTTILELGQTKNYPGSIKQIWIEKSTILRADSANGSLRITGKKVGSSKLRLNSTNETIQVLHPDQIALFEKMKDLILTKPGLDADVEDGEVVVKGYLHDWPTWKSLALELNFSNYIMKAELSADLKATLQRTIDEDLKSQGLLSVNVIQAPQLEVRFNPQQASLERYKEYFRKLGISIVVAADSLEILPVVRVDITVVEISKDSALNFGVKWPTSAEFQVLPGKLINSDNLIATLEAMETRGEARMLASPNLICRSGKEAEFLAGGEIPIKISNRKIQDIVWRKYGVLLKIKPQADSSGRISLSIETEVSNLGTSLYGDIPAILTNRVSSHFDLSHSQVVALSGLLQERDSLDVSGLAFLTQVPILGSFFSSQTRLKKKSELVIFVRPRLMDQQSSDEWTKGPSHAKTNF